MSTKPNFGVDKSSTGLSGWSKGEVCSLVLGGRQTVWSHMASVIP